MATIVLGSGISGQFPVGTTVTSHLRSAKNPGGAPVGAALESVAVAAGGTLTYVAVTLGTLYTAYASVGGQHRYVDFALSKSDLAVKREGLGGIKVVEATVNLASVGAGAIVATDVAMPAGTCKVGDLVVGYYFAALDAGLHIQGAGVVATDSVRFRVANDTAGAIDAAAASVTFAIIPV